MGNYGNQKQRKKNIELLCNTIFWYGTEYLTIIFTDGGKSGGNRNVFLLKDALQSMDEASNQRGCLRENGKKKDILRIKKNSRNIYNTQ